MTPSCAHSARRAASAVGARRRDDSPRHVRSRRCDHRPGRSAAALRTAIDRAERIALSTLVLYEWKRGPRSPDELRVQDALFPTELAAPFGRTEAELAATLYRRLRRPRGREIDIAIAACALAADAALWTLNPADFADIPGLKLYDPH